MPNAPNPEDLDAEQRAVLEELPFRSASDEYVHSERPIEWQIYASMLESDLALANVVQDEFGHARLWYDLSEEFGHTKAELIWERPANEFKHATLVEFPFAEGGWAGVVFRSYLYDTVERLRLDAFVNTSYAPLSDHVGKMLSEERYHLENAQSWFDRPAEDDNRDRIQDALDRLSPHVLSLLVEPEYEDAIVDNSFRTMSTAGLRIEWLETVILYLESLGLDVPEPDEVERPSTRGHDGTHIDHWDKLAAELRRTCDELEAPEPARTGGECV